MWVVGCFVVYGDGSVVHGGRVISRAMRKTSRGALCPDGLCCSQFGCCGSTFDYCSSGTCQIQRSGAAPPAGGLTVVISRETFDQMLKHRDHASCLARGFYTYDAFIEAAKTLPSFGSSGDVATRMREIAAFLGQTSHETSGGWASAPDGPYAWGYCFNKEPQTSTTFCDPIAPNIHVLPASKIMAADTYNSPDPMISFKKALWFWMTAQSPKPSCHDVIIGRWRPSVADTAAGRLPGYGMITNITNGGLECGRGEEPRIEDRIGYYKRYCHILGVAYGLNLDCYSQSPVGSSSLLDDT